MTKIELMSYSGTLRRVIRSSFAGCMVPRISGVLVRAMKRIKLPTFEVHALRCQLSEGRKPSDSGRLEM